MSIKYQNLTRKSSGKILLYFLIAQTVFTKILLFCRWKSKRKVGQVKKGLCCQYPFAVWFQATLFCIPFALNFSSILKFALNDKTTLNWISKCHGLTPNIFKHVWPFSEHQEIKDIYRVSVFTRTLST